MDHVLIAFAVLGVIASTITFYIGVMIGEQRMKVVVIDIIGDIPKDIMGIANKSYVRYVQLWLLNKLEKE